MPDFNIYGKIVIDINMDIEGAVDDVEAKKLAIEKIIADHHFDIEGYDINEMDCNFGDLIAIEYED
jgi:hypothetical protein